MQQLARFGVNVVDMTTAAKMLGRTRDGIAWMCKDERPQCSRVGGSSS